MGLLANIPKQQTNESVLILPKPHSISQSRLINAWQLRYDPLRPELGDFYNPFDPEWEFLPLSHPGLRFVVGACGTKFGKTYGCTIWLVQRAWEKLDPRTGLELPGVCKCWWVSPTHDQAENAFDAVKNLLPAGTYEEFRTKGKQKIHLLNPDGSIRSVIEFKSGAEPSTLRGFGVHYFVMDEVAQGMPLASYTSIDTTITLTMGHGIFISTPNGKGWFYDIYEKGNKFYNDGSRKYGPGKLADKHPEWYSVRMPSYANPYVDLKEIERKRRTMSKADFEQEVLAKFISDGAGVFTNIDGCCRGVLEEPLEGHYYVLGVDLGDKKDFTVLTVMDRVRNHVVYWERFNKTGWAWQKSRIIEVAKKYNRAVIVIDSTGVGDPVVEDLQNAGLGIKPYKISGPVAKENLIERLVVAMEQNNLSYPPGLPILVDELQIYEKRQMAGGRWQYSAPSGKNDDSVISLAMTQQLAGQPIRKYKAMQCRGI